MNNKEALRELLRYKRSQIDPSQFGWPRRTGRGRRSPGLSQAQVAQALFVSERTYAQLERGEMQSPSTALLDSVAKTLRMEERERTALYVYAVGYEPPIPADPTAGTNVAPAWQKAVNGMANQPCYINDVAWNVLAYNDEFVRMFPQVVGTEPKLPERNLIRWMLLHEDAREHHLIDWEKRWAEPVAAQLRTAVAAHPENADLQALDHEVADDPVAGPIYRRRSMAYVHPDGDTRPMRHAAYTSYAAYPAYPGARRTGLDPRQAEACCERHAPSLTGQVTMCAAQPFGSPGARFMVLMFEPDHLG